MKINVIITPEDYEAAIARLLELTIEGEPGENTPEYHEATALSALIEDYDKRHSSGIFDETPDPVDYIKYIMEQRGMRQRDMIAVFGTRQRASDILTRKRALTLPMIRRLHNMLGIPYDILLREQTVKEAKKEATYA